MTRIRNRRRSGRVRRPYRAELLLQRRTVAAELELCGGGGVPRSLRHDAVDVGFPASLFDDHGAGAFFDMASWESAPPPSDPLDNIRRIVARWDALSDAFFDAITTKSDPAWVRAWARRQRRGRAGRRAETCRE